ncbi:hypothetical protein LTR62_006255 [Meristemomyces frigidus]|uniref:SPX domain-containing protein n=1 Tax=Meristemomyces frigidus TaxID=1508187 RepID=A0AAN7YQ15_9PEZI|nr:hypothetical protein LTR62_006255 [Meristemomyces frigidus]
MKYGETLRQRSIPAWSHHNIDYDDIKLYIKEQTTPGKGKTIVVPGRGEEKFHAFELSLFNTLREQHHRIDLFVRSKAGEIQRRLKHSERQLQQLRSRASTTSEGRISVARLERYGRLENDLLKAGDEIRSLARFTSTQRTAFRKLLKKYKKWTGSTTLENRFREEVLDDPKSFMKLDLGPLLDEYSATLEQVRVLYETRIQQPPNPASDKRQVSSDSPAIPSLQAAIDSGLKAQLDTAIATVPLGENGTFASYFVHPENLVELQVLLLEHMRYFLTRSRSNSLTAPISSPPQDERFGRSLEDSADYFAVEADDAERLASEQNRLTIDEREHRQGSRPQKARVCVRWNDERHAHIAYCSSSNKCHRAEMKKKAIGSFFADSSTFSAKKSAATPESEEQLESVQGMVQQDSKLRPLYRFSSCRTRLIGTGNNEQQHLTATLDTHIQIANMNNGGVEDGSSTFPVAVLLVRQEGASSCDLLDALSHTHLVERVRGFSLEYHAIWLTAQKTKIPPPFWLPILERDIRKLPPPALQRSSSSALQTPASRGSVNNVTDSTTAVETMRSNSLTQQSELEIPPLRAFRKKRRRNYPSAALPLQETRYWSEYDHPEENGEESGGYAIYINPNDKSSFDEFFSRLGRLFKRSRRRGEEEEEQAPLLSGQASPKNDETSEDDDDDDDQTLTAKPRQKSYGAVVTPGPSTSRATQPHTYIPLSTHHAHHARDLLHIRTTCYIASLALLLVASILASTGKRKLRYQVDFGVLFAVGCSLFFGVAGFGTLVRQGQVEWSAWIVGAVVLGVDAVGCGGLGAWMLG